MAMSEVELQKIRAEISQLMATTAKLNAETHKITKETQFYPWVIVVSAMVGGIVAGVFGVLLKIV